MGIKNVTMGKWVFLSSLIMFSILSCGNKKALNKDLELMQSSPVQLPLGNMECLMNGKDTVLENFDDSKMKLIIYTDSTVCSPCALNELYLWNRIISTTNIYGAKMKYYFIFAPKREELDMVEFMLKTNTFYYPVFIDKANVFSVNNSHLPSNTMLHTFLLNERNEVIMVGSPLQNADIYDIFHQILKDELSD